MSVTGINTNAGVNGASNGNGQPGGNDLSNMFTNLLVAQIRHQDPLSPMEASQFVTQYAQMSQVQAMETMTQLSSSTAALQESMLVVNLAAQVGSSVMVATDKIAVTDQPVTLGLVLDSASSETAAVFTDDAGKTYRIPLSELAAGETQISIDPTQHELPPGKYTVKIETSSGEQPRTEVFGRLDGVRLDGMGSVMLHVAGIGDVATTDISRFLGRSSAPDTLPFGLF